MDEVQVDAEWLNTGARPVIDVMMDEERSEDGTEVTGQKRDKDSGLLRWKVEFPFKGPGDRKATVVAVTVQAAVEPDLLDQRPVFGGVKARKWHMVNRGNAMSGLSFTAESFSSADAKPSTKRAAKTEPPAPNGDRVPAKS